MAGTYVYYNWGPVSVVTSRRVATMFPGKTLGWRFFVCLGTADSKGGNSGRSNVSERRTAGSLLTNMAASPWCMKETTRWCPVNRLRGRGRTWLRLLSLACFIFGRSQVEAFCEVPEHRIAAYLLRFTLSDLDVSVVTLLLAQDELAGVRERCRTALLAVEEAIRQRDSAWQ